MENETGRIRMDSSSDTDEDDVGLAQRYKTIVELTVDGFWYIDEYGNILDVNTRYCSMTGYSYNEVISSPIWDIEADMNRSQVIYQIDRTKKLGKALFETHHFKKDGSLIDLEVSATYIDYGTPGLLCFLRDITDRKELEQKLQESERSKTVLLSNLHGMAYRCDYDRDWTMRFVSEGCYELTGYQTEDLLGNRLISFNDIIEPGYRDKIWNKWAEVLSRKETFQAEYRILTASGEVKWVWEQGKGIFDDKGNVIALEGFITDVTRQKTIEEELRESERLFRTTLYSIGDAVITTDIHGNLKQMNLIAEELTGWGEKEASGKQLEDILVIINENTREPVDIPIREVLRVGEVVGLANHILLISRNGMEIPVADSASPIINEDDEVIGVVLVFRDQTEERAAREAIAESEARFRLLVESAPEAIFVQTDWRFAYLNPKTLKLLGAASPAQLLGKNVIDHFDTRSQDTVKELIHGLKGDKQDVHLVEETFIRLDGSSFVAEVAVVPINYGGADSVLVFFRDITERKEAEEAIIKAKMASDIANRSKSEFLANTSHELRTPLSSIIGFSDLLIEGTMGELNEKQKRYVTTINKSGNLLLNLINNILDLSQIEFGEMDLECVKFDIVDAINDVHSMISILSSRKNISIDMDIDLPQRMVVADNEKIKEILYNLLDNALKFTPDGGRITIRAIQKDTGFIQLSVSDTGIGIPKDDINKIFEPFYQSDGSTTRRYSGTGLGLTIIKKFVKMHGGNIWVKSEPGKGSAFFFTIPVLTDCTER
ncbi:PAS domain-containing protein [Methanolobus profundi]|nr:PAS domain S-box protein [Methanolobus profundi]